SSPKAATASRPAALKAATRSASVRTTRIPLPPPPAAALISKGYPRRSAARMSSAVSLGGASSAFNTGTPAAAAVRRAEGFGAHGGNRLRSWPDIRQAGVLHCAGEGRVFREKPVAGMYRIGAGGVRRFNQSRNVEITLLARGGTDADRCISLKDVRRKRVGL